MLFRIRLILALIGTLLFSTLHPASAVIRDGGIDPANLGQGGWIYIMSNATNHLYPSNVPSVTNEVSMFAYLKSQGMNYVIVKAGMTNQLWTGSGSVPIGAPGAQFTGNVCAAAHTAGIKIFGSNRSGGDRNDKSVIFDDALIAGEVAVSDYIFNQGADGFIWDAESQWESQGTNGQAQAWNLCSTVRAHWPNKFLAHNPFDTLYLHSSFPYKEFGYWSDSVIPQTYHHSASQGNAFAAMTWTDVNFKKFQDSLLTMAPSIIDGQTVYWTNAIKPVLHMRDVSSFDQDFLNFVDYTVADPNCVTAGGYKGSSYFRSELQTPAQWAYVKQATIGVFPNVVNNIILDDNVATQSGAWSVIKTISATTSTVTFSGFSGTDTNSFGTNYWSKGRGTGAGYMEFAPAIVTAGDYNCYEWHPYRAEASSAVPVNVTYDGGTATLFINQKTNVGNWSFLGQFPFAAGTNNNFRFTDGFPEVSGIAMVDGLKMVFIPPTSLPLAPSGLTASPLVSSQVTLNWVDNSANEAGFVILRGVVNGGPYGTVGFVTRNVTTFTDTNAPAGSTYYYIVRATNYLGVSPNSNQVSPLTPPVITKQPQSITVGQFSPASFTVTAIGAPLTYQWRKEGVPLSITTNISSTTSSNLVIASAQQPDIGNYSVFISNAAGSTTSITATLAVATVPPSIVTQPANKTAGAGSTVSIGVIANGTQPLIYQWKKNGTTILVDGTAISGATTATLTLAGVLKANEGNYSVTITNLYGNITSSNAALTVIDPTITSQPFDLVRDAGATAVFTVAAGGTPTLAYQWKKNGTNMVNGGKVLGALTSSLTITNVLQVDSANYTVQVSNGIGNAISTAAHLTVNDPILVSQPVSGTNIAGTSATFSVSAYGTLPISYSWKKGGSVLSNGGNVSGATSSSLTIANVSQVDATTYSVVVSNSSSSLSSAAVSLTVIDPPAITTQPQSLTVIRDSNVVFTVTATGTQPLFYQWRFNGTNIAGATKSFYSLPNVQTNKNGSYSVFLNNAGGTLFSSNALLIVNVPFEIFNVQPITRANSVILNWGTTSNSTSQVEYGPTASMGYFSPVVTTPVTNHSILLTSLKLDTTYYCRVISQIGPISISSNATFFTSSSLVVDNPDAIYSGAWTPGVSSTDKYGTYYQYTPVATGTSPTASATYTPNIPLAAKYDVYTWYGWQTSRSTNTPMIIFSNGNSITSRVDQTTNTGSWQLVAKAVNFAAGTSGYARVANNTDETNRVVVADAFMWQYNLEQDIPTNGTVPDWWANFYFGSVSVNGQADPDGDGYSTYAEYVLGTTPNDPASKLNFRIQQLGSNVVQATFSPFVAGRNYELRYTTDLNVLNWVNTAASSLVLSNGLGVITTTNLTGMPAFYRLSVSLAP